MLITYDYLAKYGQLGNQMFQYALLLGVKYKTEAQIAFSQEIKERSYLFTFFNLKEYVIDETIIYTLHQEKHFHFDSSVFDIDQNTNFKGYFQSEKYFQHCADVVKEEFTFNEKITAQVDSFLEPYKGKKLVSLHVRRGDYLVNPTYHPQPPNEYYYNAMDMLDDGNTVFICVSNDKPWCEENLKRDNLIYQFNDLAFDMCLISKCDDHIIANSSFSWWGAWLGNNPDKRVIAPRTWFGPAAGGLDTKDIYCDYFTIM
jgi:hypothetical protein